MHTLANSERVQSGKKRPCYGISSLDTGPLSESTANFREDLPFSTSRKYSYKPGQEYIFLDDLRSCHVDKIIEESIWVGV